MTVRTLTRTIGFAVVVWCAALFPEKAAAQCAVSWSDSADTGNEIMAEALVEDYYGNIGCGGFNPGFYHEYSLLIQMSCGTQYQEVADSTTVYGGGGSLLTSVTVAAIETTVCNINISAVIWCSAIFQPIYEAWEAIQRDARPRPINFREKIPGAGAGPGRLHFEYEWDSSGAPGDIADCLVGENVAYPNGNPFIWPNPPYGTSTSNIQTTNPLISTVAGDLLQLEDNHLLPTPFRPAADQVPNVFSASQRYRWSCPGINSNVAVTFNTTDAIHLTRLMPFIPYAGRCSMTTAHGNTRLRNLASQVVTTPSRDAWVVGLAGRMTYCFTVFAATFFALLSPEVVARPVADLVVVRIEVERDSAVLHVPVYATFVVQNTQPERLEFDLGPNSKTTFAFSITQPDGKIVHIPSFKTPEGVSAIGRVRLENGLTYTQKILLNEWYDFTSPGQYSIELRTSATFKTSSGRAVETTPIQPIVLEIQQRDQKRLQSICSDLATAALTLSLGTQKRTTAAVTLSFVRDPVAIPFLVQLLERGDDVVNLPRYAVEGLIRIGTTEALGALIESVGAARYGSSHTEIVSGLARVRAQTADEELKRRIDDVLRR